LFFIIPQEHVIITGCGVAAFGITVGDPHIQPFDLTSKSFGYTPYLFIATPTAQSSNIISLNTDILSIILFISSFDM
jgi:hypothetical protein